MRLPTLQSLEELSIVTAVAAIGLLVGCGATGGGNAGPGITCSCSGSGPSPGAENRVHIGNMGNLPGIKVVLTTGSQTCTINELLVTPPDEGLELDQCVMDTHVGDEISIAATTTTAQGASAICIVDPASLDSGMSTNPQTFADVFIQPVTVVCGTGFAF
jgi:hypothetical protein